MADGMDESPTTENANLALGQKPESGRTKTIDQDLREDRAAEPAAHQALN
jgi:hypothetical protein